MRTIAFPGFGIELSIDRAAFTVFGHPIYWYGIIIAAGFLLAVFFCSRKAKRFGIEPDHVLDLLLFGVPAAIIGARLYYIVFYLDYFRNENGSLNFVQMLRIWDGGLAIYGGIIAGFITLFLFCRAKKITFFAFSDLMVFGLFIGQAIGRWGNFVNIEAYGSETTLPWRMGIVGFVNGAWQYMEVHPTFLYESIWNAVGFVLLLIVLKKGRKFDGEITLDYFLWYGIGRAIIEGLRTDSLYFFTTTLRVSQILAIGSALVALALLVWNLAVRKHNPNDLYVHRVQARAKAAALETENLAKIAADAPTEEGQSARIGEGDFNDRDET